MGYSEPRILYFVPELLASSNDILHAQVLTPARRLAASGFKCMFVGTEVSNEAATLAAEGISDRYGIPAYIFGVYSCEIPYFSLVLTGMRAASLARFCVREYQPTHVYARGYTSSPAARKVASENGALSVFDARGTVAEESALKRGKGLVYRLLLGLELHELRKADRLACVSNRFKDWIKNHTRRDDVIVIPSCVDTQKFYFDARFREEIRCRCDFSDHDTVICYSGGLGRWQRISDIVCLFSRISQLRPDFKFLILTNRGREMEIMVRASSLPADKYAIRSCSHSEVPQYLSAADAGIILRADNVVNNVASPIKIGEYLSCGLPVILTRGIGDYSEDISKAGIGVVLDECTDVVAQIMSFMEQDNFGELRAKAIAFAHEYISLDSHLDSFRRLFSLEDSA